MKAVAFTVLVALLVACVGGGEPNLALDNGSPTATAIPVSDSLESYWDKAACYDVFAVLLQMYDLGYTADETMNVLENLEGTIAEFGPSNIIVHCTDRYYEA